MTILRQTSQDTGILIDGLGRVKLEYKEYL